MNGFSPDWVLLTYTVIWSTSQFMKKEPTTIIDRFEEFAAKIADQEDNPSIHELAKEFPEKTYMELEKYRDADRHQEADKIPLTEAQKNLVDHIERAVSQNKIKQLSESEQKQEELEPIADGGACVMGEMRKDREDRPTKMELEYRQLLKNASEASRLALLYEKEHKVRQEAEGELSIMKGIETNRVKEAQEALANALEVNESHQRLNGKLQVRIAELEDDNKKMHKHLDKQVEAARKAGL
tara:strand:- start:863 stop:1585 length:723 start_codon:yes stop_codon:yes gene_type:complete